MCSLHIFLSALLLSLALGPHVKLLHAQETEASPDYVVSTESTEVSGNARNSEDSNLDVTEQPTEDATFAPETVESTDPITVPNSSTISSKDMPTEPQTTSSKELPTTTEPPVTTVITTTMRTTIMMTTTMMEPSTAMARESADLESTSELLKDTTAAHNVITTVYAVPPTIQTSALTTVHESTKASETTSTLIMTTEEIKQTTPSTTEITDIITTQPPTVPSSDPSDITNEDTEESTTITSVIVSISSKAIIPGIGMGGTGSKNTEHESGPSWLLYIIIAVAIICVVSAFCVIIFVRRKKKSRSQRFGSGYMNGRNQRSKKKKGEEDAWAGPVNLEGGDKAECESPEELGQGGDKHPDGTDLTLSTFVASEANGGVGRPGSMEAQKWEEQEPLLYIDEDAKSEAKEKQNEGVEKEKEVGQKEEEDAKGKTEMKEVKQNEGEAFCLTTAV